MLADPGAIRRVVSLCTHPVTLPSVMNDVKHASVKKPRPNCLPFLHADSSHVFFGHFDGGLQGTHARLRVCTLSSFPVGSPYNEQLPLKDFRQDHGTKLPAHRACERLDLERQQVCVLVVGG